jgi:hypothetical protein
MTSLSKDSQLAIQAARILIDDRDPVADRGEVMVTLERLVTLVLLAVMEQKPRAAAAMLTEGLAPGVESRLALYASKQAGKR